MTEKTVDAETRRSLHPRYWPTWLGLGVLWFITRLPYRWAMAVGDGIGLVAYRVSRYRRHIVEINLQLCFPELSDRDRQQLARRNFMYTGRGLVELGLAAWLPESRIRGLATVEGGEHVERAVSQGRGVILLGGHFTALDMLGRALLTRVRFQVIFRENRNPVIERFMAGSRRRDFDEALNRRDMRGLVRALRAGRVVWYPPDQDYGRRYSVFAPLFGVPASTITVPAR
ncbi:MAG: lipid A biosynthesis lauroyl acyltransferase, partial [Ectothiorhodospiraceae bacterium]